MSIEHYLGTQLISIEQKLDMIWDFASVSSPVR